MTRADGPLKRPFAGISTVPSTARAANVFLTTFNSALALRNCFRSSATWFASSPTHSVITAIFARANFSCISAMAVAFSSFFMVLSSPSVSSVLSARNELNEPTQRNRSSAPLLRDRDRVESDSGSHRARNRRRLQIAALDGCRPTLHHRFQDGVRVLIQPVRVERNLPDRHMHDAGFFDLVLDPPLSDLA